MSTPDRPVPWRLESLTPRGTSRIRIVLGRALVSGPLPADPIPLDTRVDDPVEVWVDDRLAARGEVVVIEGKLAVKIASLTVGEGSEG